MGRDLGPRLPEDLLLFLGAPGPPEKFASVLVLTTVGGDGFPRHALLSPYEVAARSESRLLLLLYKDSSTSDNLRARQRLSMLVVDPSMSYTVNGLARERAALPEAPNEALFEVAVSAVREDRLPTARITSGLRFEGFDPGMTPEDRRLVFARLLALPLDTV